jgi:hypothetical protein
MRRPSGSREKTVTMLVPLLAGTMGGIFGGIGTVLTTAVLNPPACVNQALFVADITIPDGTQVAAGERFDKRWLVLNAEGRNHCTWTADYNIVWIGGPNLAEPTPSFPVQPTSPGQEVTITANMIAPSTPGTYKSTWILRSPDGELFGDPFWATIEVK